jgi:hypothetical protein
LMPNSAFEYAPEGQKSSGTTVVRTVIANSNLS